MRPEHELEGLLKVAVRAIPSPKAVVYRCTANKLVMECQKGLAADELPRTPLPRTQSLSGWVLEKGKSWSNNRIGHHISAAESALEPYCCGAFLSAPLIGGSGGPVGLLNFCRPAGKPAFDRQEATLASFLGRSMARCLETLQAPGQTGTLSGFTARQSVRAASTLFHQALNPIFLINNDGSLQDANPEGLAFLECLPAQLDQKKIWDYCPAAQRARVRESWSRTRVPRAIEMSFRIGEREKTLVVNVVPLHRDGRAAYFGIGQDVTAQRQAQAALRKSEKRYRQILAHLPAVVLEADGQGTVHFINEAIARITGRTPDEIKGKHLSDLLAPDLAPDARDRIIADFLQGALVEEPTSLKVKRGAQRIVAWTSLSHANASGTKDTDTDTENERIVGFGVDITQRHQAEKEREKLQKQLFHSQRLDSLGRLAGGVAHDFNNILTIIINYAKFLEMATAAEDPRIHDIRQIAKAGDRAAEMTRQLLAFGRRELIKPEVVDVNRIVCELEKMLCRTLGEHIQLELDLDPELKCVQMDPGQLEQALVNLVVNARDAMPRGGKVTVRTRNAQMEDEKVARYESIQPGPHVRIMVQDNGCGMDPEIAEKVFEPFYTTKKSGQGTGLGLAMVYGIVKRVGGGIWLQTRTGRGTLFTIDLPAVSSAETRAPTPPSSEVPKLGRGETVLIVEDEAGVRRSAARILGRFGYRVIPAANGLEAIEIARKSQEKIDLLLTDVVMPEISGPELVDELLAHEPTLKTIYMSGYADELLDDHGVLPEDVHFLKKPFTIRSLSATVRHVLDQEDDGGQAEPELSDR